MSKITKIQCKKSCEFNLEDGFQASGYIIEAGKEYNVPGECTNRNAQIAVANGWAVEIKTRAEEEYSTPKPSKKK